MLQKIKDSLPERGLRLDPRLALLGMVAMAALLAVAIVFYLWRDNQSFRPLYGAGESFPAAEVMQVLDAEALSYRIHPQSGQVLVREDQLGQARMLLSAKGVRVSLPAGYELFDREEPLGTSQFVQNVRLKRSLEGELARTVMSLRGIEQARVHLAQEESSSFVVSKRAPPKASVTLLLSPGYKLKPEQVGAIINLVANSVPQLKPEDISVVDQYGALLSRGVNAWGGPSQNWQLVDDYQQKATANIEEVLAPVLGHGNYRISVAADIDFSQKEETFQAFGEDPRLRSEVLRNESALDQLALGVPGSLSNRPVVPAAEAEMENRAATSLREESTRQLDYDQSVTHVKHPAFSLRHQSVAVVLNARSAPEEGWSNEARADLENMIRRAVGLNEARGDLLSVSVFPFVPVQIPVEEEPLWWENGHVHSLIKLGLTGFLGLLLLIIMRSGIRSLTRRSLPLPENVDDGPPLLTNERLPALVSEEPSGGAPIFGELNPLSEIKLPAPGSGLELQIQHLQMLAENEPERVSEVIKHWIGRNERDLSPVS